MNNLFGILICSVIINAKIYICMIYIWVLSCIKIRNFITNILDVFIYKKPGLVPDTFSKLSLGMFLRKEPSVNITSISSLHPSFDVRNFRESKAGLL